MLTPDEIYETVAQFSDPEELCVDLIVAALEMIEYGDPSELEEIIDDFDEARHSLGYEGTVFSWRSFHEKAIDEEEVEDGG